MTCIYTTALGILRPAGLGDTQLRIMAGLGKSASAFIRIYVNSMLEISVPSPLDMSILVPEIVETDNVTMLLRIERVSSHAQDESSLPQLQLQLGDELSDSLSVSLDDTNLRSIGLESCSDNVNSEVVNFVTWNIAAVNVSLAGQFSYDVVMNFTSTDINIENDLRRSNRDINVAQTLRVDLEGVCVCVCAGA